MDSFAYHLAWVILAVQATLVVVRRVVGFAQFLWQEYVWSKIKRGWRRSRLIEMHNIAHDESYKKDKSLMTYEDPYFDPPTQGAQEVHQKNAEGCRKREGNRRIRSEAQYASRHKPGILIPQFSEFSEFNLFILQGFVDPIRHPTIAAKRLAYFRSSI